LDDESVNTIITSPPYWGLRDYGEDTKTIWDGDKDCEHNWIEHIKPAPGGRPLKESNVGRWKDAMTKNYGLEGRPQKSNFCSKCGAWYGQLGLEPTLDLYISHLLQVTAELKRVLRKDGIMFWNQGDSYHAHGARQRADEVNWSESSWRSGNRDSAANAQASYKKYDTPDKSLNLQNFRLIFKMIDNQGWILRNTIIWNKPNHMPSSVKDRFANGYEPVFMLTKNNNPIYYYNIKTGLMADRKAKDPKENIDWEWRDCPNCKGTGKIEKEKETKIEEEMAEEMGSPRARYHRDKIGECKRCKGTGKIKYSFWRALDYWFDLDAVRVPYTPSGIERHKKCPVAKFTMKDGRPSVSTKDTAERVFIPLHPSGKNPGDYLSVEEVNDFPILAIEEHTAILGVKEFEDFSNFVSVIVNKLVDSSFTMPFGNDNADITELSEDMRNFRQKLLSARPMQPNLISVAGNPYATITVKQSSNEIGIEFGRNRWIFRSESFSNRDTSLNKIKSQFFAINTKIVDIPFFILMNWMSGLPLSFDIINQLQIFRSKSDCITFSSFHNATITKEQTQDISRMMSNFAKVFFIESMLCSAYIFSNAISKKSMIMTTAKKTANNKFSTSSNFTDFFHTINIPYFDKEVKEKSDVWKIPTQPFPEAHFATFPEKLVSPMILAGCPQSVCKKCGKARVRIIDRIVGDPQGGEVDQKRLDGGVLKSGGKPTTSRPLTNIYTESLSTTRETIGWTDCGCNAGWTSGIVLDPFAGAGTVGVVAKKLNRGFIGIDIKEKYCTMAANRIKNITPSLPFEG